MEYKAFSFSEQKHDQPGTVSSGTGQTYEAVIIFKLNTEIQCLIFDAILSFDK